MTSMTDVWSLVPRQNDKEALQTVSDRFSGLCPFVQIVVFRENTRYARVHLPIGSTHVDSWKTSTHSRHDNLRPGGQGLPKWLKLCWQSPQRRILLIDSLDIVGSILSHVNLEVNISTTQHSSRFPTLEAKLLAGQRRIVRRNRCTPLAYLPQAEGHGKKSFSNTMSICYICIWYTKRNTSIYTTFRLRLLFVKTFLYCQILYDLVISLLFHPWWLHQPLRLAGNKYRHQADARIRFQTSSTAIGGATSLQNFDAKTWSEICQIWSTSCASLSLWAYLDATWGHSLSNLSARQSAPSFNCMRECAMRLVAVDIRNFQHGLWWQDALWFTKTPSAPKLIQQAKWHINQAQQDLRNQKEAAHHDITTEIDSVTESPQRYGKNHEESASTRCKVQKAVSFQGH